MLLFVELSSHVVDLEELYFARAEIEGPVPTGLLSHPKLRKLDLTRNFLKGELPKPKGACSH